MSRIATVRAFAGLDPDRLQMSYRAKSRGVGQAAEA
jgi:hypothetical protein